MDKNKTVAKEWESEEKFSQKLEKKKPWVNCAIIKNFPFIVPKVFSLIFSYSFRILTFPTSFF